MLAPSIDIAEPVKAAAETLGVEVGWFHEGRLHLRLGEPGHTLALSSDSASRIRVDACHLAGISDTRWVVAGDRRRLAQVVRELAGTAVPA